MASSPRPRLQNKILSTLAYFDRYDYPLTKTELEYWSGVTAPSPRKYYFLPGRSSLVKLRQVREKISQQKWQIARQVGEKLKKIPTIAAVFVTGALAMNNAPVDDDIDLMIVTYPNALWPTRFWVNLYLHQTRRYPGQTSAPDKICPNLWLDLNHLMTCIHNRSLYTAHEILQAKVLWDRANVHARFLGQNSWVQEYLPNAYRGSFPTRAQRVQDAIPFGLLLWPINLLFFIAQYLYMLPKKTTERVGLGYAFFHPRG